MKRGDVVIVQFPYVDGSRGKNRPALVVQNDRDNQRLTHTVIAMITGNTRHVGEATQVLVDPATVDGRSAGLNGPSAIKCGNLFTIAQQDVLRLIGQLSPSLLKQTDQALKAALQLT
jgi:mRNA-degrading endonuclease toxin of MazEF toxin-antitoxin module